MKRSDPTERADILEQAVALLTKRLPPSWAVEKASIGGAAELDLVVKGPGGSSQGGLLVETKSQVSAKDVQLLMGGPWRRWRTQVGNQPLLLIAPYIAPRVRELLTVEDVNYVDLSGNVRISLPYPGLFIEASGADRDPRRRTSRRGLGGAKVGAVVRVLIDATPPFSGAEIARAADVNEGYASRLLETLNDEGLIDRDSRGPIEQVDWPALIRRRAEAVDLFRPSRSFRYIARSGARGAMEELASRPAFGREPLITGSFAASRLSAVAAPELLVLYTRSPSELAKELGLLPSDAGADTILVRPEGQAVFNGSSEETGLWWAAPSQVAIDCLAGSGRMPSEGEAVIEWMRVNQDRWRYPTIRALVDASDEEKTL